MTLPPLDLGSDPAQRANLQCGLDGDDADALLDEIDRLRDGIAAIHYPVEVEPSETICAGCSTRRGSGSNVRFFPYVEWPCETAALLEATS